MMEQYQPEKWIWTEADFDVMGWHDVCVHAFAFSEDNFQFLLDIDYIFQWVPPRPGETYFNFWVAPATLVFESVHHITMDIETNGPINIDGIERTEPQMIKTSGSGEIEEWLWKVACHQGRICFRATGYKQFIRTVPRFKQAQALDYNERGGFSFIVDVPMNST